MQITVLNVTKQNATAGNGKPYQKLEVAYKDSFGKVASKPIMPFGTQKPAFDALAEAKSGSVFTITVVKNDKGYNDWTAAVEAAPGTTMTQPTTDKAVNVKSTYETPEERAKKQVYIIRQSSLSSAIDTLSVGSKSVNPDDVLKLAQRYVSWVMQGPEDVAKQDLFTLPNDIEVQ